MTWNAVFDLKFVTYYYNSFIITYYIFITYYYIINYYLLLHFLLLHCYYIIIMHYYIIIITYYYDIIITHYYIIITSLLHHYYLIITSLFPIAKQIIMSSLLHIMHYLCFHFYTVITHNYYYYPSLHVTIGATCRWSFFLHGVVKR